MTKTFLLIGQSNMEKEWTYSSSPPSPVANTRMYQRNTGGWGVPYGNGAIRLANALNSAFGEPIDLIASAIGSTGLVQPGFGGADYWLHLGPGTIYQNSLDDVANSGSMPDQILFHQGEADASGGVSRIDYFNGLNTLYSNYLTDLGKTFNELKLGCAVLGNMGDGTLDSKTNNIRYAQLSWGLTSTGFGGFYSGSSVDMVRAPADQYHWTWALGLYYERMARRYAQACAYQAGRASYGSNGPSIQSVQALSGGSTFWLFTNASQLYDLGGSTSGANVTGLRVTKAGVVKTITSTSFSGSKILVNISETIDSPSNYAVDYQFGTNPNITNGIFDGLMPQGDTVGTPLQITDGSIVASQLVNLPITGMFLQP